MGRTLQAKKRLGEGGIKRPYKYASRYVSRYADNFHFNLALIHKKSVTLKILSIM